MDSGLSTEKFRPGDCVRTPAGYGFVEGVEGNSYRSMRVAEAGEEILREWFAAHPDEDPFESPDFAELLLELTTESEPNMSIDGMVHVQLMTLTGAGDMMHFSPSEISHLHPDIQKVMKN